MALKEFPDFVKRMSEVDINWPGIRGWCISGDAGQVVFMECDEPTEVGEHSHGAQIGIVMAGELELTVNGKTRKYGPGTTYQIDAGARHSGKLSAGFKAIDVFEERDRYKVRTGKRLNG